MHKKYNYSRSRTEFTFRLVYLKVTPIECLYGSNFLMKIENTKITEPTTYAALNSLFVFVQNRPLST